MKTIEEATKDFLEYRRGICTGYPPKEWFKAGVEFAQRWIPVGEELPEDIETKRRENIPCIVSNGQTKTIAHRRYSHLTKKWNWNIMMDVTHWRPIEIK